MTQALRSIYASPCKSVFTDTYGSDFFTPYIQQGSGYSQALQALLKQETSLKSSYYTAADAAAKKQILVDLIAIRRKIIDQANADYQTSYSSYDDYAYAASFGRDFTAETQQTLPFN